MANFTLTTATKGVQAKELYREIEASLYYRFSLTGAAGVPSWATSTGSTPAGRDIQRNVGGDTGATFWYERQTAFETLITNAAAVNAWFLKVGSVGSPGSARPDYSNAAGLATIPRYTVPGDLWYMVTGNTTGPRARTSMTGYPLTGWRYRKHVVGDIIGPWLVDDMQLACRFLRFTVHNVVNATWQATNKVTARDPLTNADFSPSDRYVLRGGGVATVKSRAIWGRSYTGWGGGIYGGDWSEVYGRHANGDNTYPPSPANAYITMGDVFDNPRVAASLASTELGETPVERMAARLYSPRYWSKSWADNASLFSLTEAGETRLATTAAFTHKADVYAPIWSNGTDGIGLDVHTGVDGTLVPLVGGVGPAAGSHDPVNFDPWEYAGIGNGNLARLNHDASFSADNPRVISVAPARDAPAVPLHSFTRATGIQESAAAVPLYGWIMKPVAIWVCEWSWPYT